MAMSCIMSRYSVAEAKNNLPKLIDRALNGEEVTITRRGEVVVALVSRKAAPTAQELRDWYRDHATPVIPAKPFAESHAELIRKMRDEEPGY